jgi:hypothetical protein
MNTINQNIDEIPQNNNNIEENSPKETSNKINLAETEKEKNNPNPQGNNESNIDEDLEYENIKNSRFKQQRLPAWRPVPTILSIIITFSFFGVAFIFLGVVLLIYSKKIKFEEVDYTDCKVGENCTKSLIIKEDISKPVYVYYQLDGFFQNSRRYVKSKEVAQLTGDKPYSKENCDPVETNEEMGFSNETKSMNNETYLNPSDIAIPCGLMAKTFFNDNFSFFIKEEEVEEIVVDQKNIAFDKDKKLYSKEPDPSRQWTNITDEHFLVWMRPSGLPNPRKLWGKIDRDLKKDEIITINITNNYDVSYYEGKKKIILSNTTIFGGNNKFLAICYIIVGGLSLISAIFFPIGYKLQMQKEKDL